MAASDLQLPPGFRFHPTDEELVTHYLCRRCTSQPISVPIIAEIDLYKYDPWELPDMALYGEKEWYFFSPRDRKYPNGCRPNRAAGSGYWKATGADKPIGNPKPVAIKKALVFYAGKAPKGEKTNWIMHEYRLADVDRSARKKGSGLRLDEWVLCRIYNKKGIIERPATGKNSFSSNTEQLDKKREIEQPSAGQPSTATASHTTTMNDYMQFDTSDSIHHPLGADSSCSEHVVSPCDKEVQSEPKWGEFGNIEFGYDYTSLDSAFVPGTGPFQQGGNHFSPLPDMFMFLPKPF